MSKISQTRLLAATLGCLAIAAASISLAQDPSSAAQPNQTPAATQTNPSADQPASQPGASKTDAAASAGQQTANKTDQPASSQGAQQANSQQSQSGGQQSTTTTQSATESQKSSNNAQQSTGRTGDAQRSNSSNSPDWPAPQRYGAARPGMNDSQSGQGASLGVSILADTQGITVMRVYPGTPAQRMGLRPRDRITSVNGQNVDSSDEFISAIRGMNPNDEVELGIARGDNPTTVRGKLEPFSEARRRAPIASGEDMSPNRLSRDSGRDNDLQTTSYEERNQSGRSQFGDVESRLTRVEQQLDQLTRDITEIRNSIRPNQSTSTATTSAPPEPAAVGQPRTRGPSPFRPTPGQPPTSSPPVPSR
jgi:hypothetical protein